MVEDLTQAEREVIYQYILAGQRINAMKTLREALRLPLKEVVELSYLLYSS